MTEAKGKGKGKADAKDAVIDAALAETVGGEKPADDLAARIANRTDRVPMVWKGVIGVLVLVLVASVWWMTNLPGDPDPGGNGNGTGTPAGATTNPDGPNADSPEVAGLTEEKRREVLRDLQYQQSWWTNVDNPLRPDERHAYMTKMLDSMEMYITYGASRPVQSAMQAQKARKQGQPVYLALNAFLQAHSPPPAGTSQSRADAMRTLRGVLEIDRSFAHAWYLLGQVMMMDQMSNAQAGAGLNTDALREAAGCMQQALRLYDGFPDAHRALASVFETIGDATQAIHHARAALDLDTQDPQNWALYLRVLVRTGATRELAAVPQALAGLDLPAKVRFQVLGSLAEYYANAGRLEDAWDAMQRTTAVAMTDKSVVERDEQWVQLYLMTGRLAVMISRPDVELAFDYLQRGVDYAREHEMSLTTPIAGWASVIAALFRTGTPGATPERLGQLYGLCLDALESEKPAPTDDDRDKIEDVLFQFLGQTNLPSLDAPLRWRLTPWLIEQAHGGEHEWLEIAVGAIQATMPISGDGDDRAIASDVLAGGDPATVTKAIHLLIDLGLESSALRVNFPSAEWLGYLLRATDGAQDERFAAKATGLLAAPESRRGETVCRVLQIHPVASLRPAVLAAMQRAVQAGDARACRGLFSVAHPALNAIGPAVEADWSPGASTTIEEYQRILSAHSAD